MFATFLSRGIGGFVKLGAIILFIFIFFVIPDEWDKHRNYSPARASIVSAMTSCRLGASHKPSRYMPCDKAKEALKTDPELGGYTISQFTKLSVRFVSPVDGKPHVAPLTLQAGESDWKNLRVGEVIDVIASKTQPEKVRDPVFGHLDVTDPTPFTAVQAGSKTSFAGDR